MPSDTVVAEWASVVLDARSKVAELEANLKEGQKLGLGQAKRLTKLFAGRRTPAGEPLGSYCPALGIEAALLRSNSPLLGVAATMEFLLDGVEFKTIKQFEDDDAEEAAALIEVVFTSRVPTENDVVSKRMIPAKASVIPELQRQSAGPNGPEWRLVVSLPWWLIATEYERQACLHHALNYLGRGKNHKPILRKPDITGFAANFSRYGINDIRHAQAIAAAAAHPQTNERLQRWSYDLHGQGLMWDPRCEIEGGRSEERQIPTSAAAKIARSTGKASTRRAGAASLGA